MAKKNVTHQPSPKKSSTPNLPTAKDKLYGWTIADGLLETYASSLLILEHPKVRKEDIWKMLGRLDITGTVRKRLDRSAFDTTPKSQLKPLVDLYTAAMITEIAKKCGILELFEKTELVQFHKDASQDPHDSMHVPNDYDKCPAVAPLQGDVPGLSFKYLEILQTRIEAEIARQGIRSSGIGIEKVINGQEAVFLEKIGFKGLYNETIASLGDFLLNLAGEDARKISRRLAEKGAPVLFMWHVTLGHFDEMICKLLSGTRMELVSGICPECRAKAMMNAARVPSSRKFRKKLKNN